MSKPLTLGFFKGDQLCYQQAKAENALYCVSLDYAETHKGLDQGAIYDALEIINETKRCFGLSDEKLSYVLLDGETIIDCA